MSWEKNKKFTDYIEVNPSVSLEKGNVYPFVDMANLSTNGRNPVNIEKKCFYSGMKFQKGDTVIAGIEPCLQNGKKFFCKDIDSGFGSTEYLVFRPKQNMDPYFLYYFMQKQFIRQSMINSMSGGTGRQRVNKNIFNNLKIDVPTIDEQRIIGTILSSYDSLIENSQRQIKLLEETAHRFYKEWFVNLRFPGHENVKITDGVPDGWQKQKIEKLVTVLRRGISPEYSDEGKYIVLNQKCIRSSRVTFEESKKQDKKYPDELNVKDSDTVICSTGTGTLGRVGQIYGDYPATTIDSHVTLVRAITHPNLLYYSIKAKQEYLMGRGIGSTNQLELYKDVIGETEILWPSIDISSQFEKMATAIHEMITVLDQKIKRCIEARDRLLPKLMSGEIEL